MTLEQNQTVVIHPTEPNGIGGFSYLAFDKVTVLRGSGHLESRELNLFRVG